VGVFFSASFWFSLVISVFFHNLLILSMFTKNIKCRGCVDNSRWCAVYFNFLFSVSWEICYPIQNASTCSIASIFLYQSFVRNRVKAFWKSKCTTSWHIYYYPAGQSKLHVHTVAVWCMTSCWCFINKSFDVICSTKFCLIMDSSSLQQMAVKLTGR